MSAVCMFSVCVQTSIWPLFVTWDWYLVRLCWLHSTQKWRLENCLQEPFLGPLQTSTVIHICAGLVLVTVVWLAASSRSGYADYIPHGNEGEIAWSNLFWTHFWWAQLCIHAVCVQTSVSSLWYNLLLAEGQNIVIVFHVDRKDAKSLAVIFLTSFLIAQVCKNSAWGSKLQASLSGSKLQASLSNHEGRGYSLSGCGVLLGTRWLYDAVFVCFYPWQDKEYPVKAMMITNLMKEIENVKNSNQVRTQ